MRVTQQEHVLASNKKSAISIEAALIGVKKREPLCFALRLFYIFRGLNFFMVIK
jgi:hypothetical protein